MLCNHPRQQLRVADGREQASQSKAGTLNVMALGSGFECARARSAYSLLGEAGAKAQRVRAERARSRETARKRKNWRSACEIRGKVK